MIEDVEVDRSLLRIGFGDMMALIDDPDFKAFTYRVYSQFAGLDSVVEPGGKGATGEPIWPNRALKQLIAKVDAGFGALADDEANIVAAIRDNKAAVELSPEQLQTFMAGVIAALPPGVSLEQLQDALRTVFLDAGTK
jgi:hypothetical protein